MRRALILSNDCVKLVEMRYKLLVDEKHLVGQKLRQEVMLSTQKRMFPRQILSL